MISEETVIVCLNPGVQIPLDLIWTLILQTDNGNMFKINILNYEDAPFPQPKGKMLLQFLVKFCLVRKPNVLDITVCQQYWLLIYLEKQGLLQSSPLGYGELLRNCGCDPSSQQESNWRQTEKWVALLSCSCCRCYFILLLVSLAFSGAFRWSDIVWNAVADPSSISIFISGISWLTTGPFYGLASLWH